MAEDSHILTDLNGRSAEGPVDSHESAEAVGDRPELTVAQILAWADAHHAAHGAWPEVRLLAGLGPVDGAPGESWKAINYALAMGLRGLPGDSSLAELLAEHRGLPMPDMGAHALAEKIWAWEQEQFPLKGPGRRRSAQRDLRPLTTNTILAWADAHLAATGAWPTTRSGHVRGAPFDVTWATINSALYNGSRGLPGGSSLPRVRAEFRQAERREPGPSLTLEQILAWADAHYVATGSWPANTSGPVLGAPRENWANLDTVLKYGKRGLEGGLSVSRMLAEHRGTKARRKQEEISIPAILGWADAYHAVAGAWPSSASGWVQEAPIELTWGAIDMALGLGRRGLPGDSSLARVLAEHRPELLPLTIERILDWADAHHTAGGSWPDLHSGDVPGASGDDWRQVDRYLKEGGRGLPGGSSLDQVLSQYRAVPPAGTSAFLSVEKVLEWADTHHATHGVWPRARSGAIDGAPGETWSRIDRALTEGLRGLPGSTALASLLQQHRGQRNFGALPHLNVDQILAWADAHFAAHGHWPTESSGPVTAAPGETWRTISSALAKGHRGLSAGTTLRRILIQYRGRSQRAGVHGLTVDQILAWADVHFAAHGRWPSAVSGPIDAAPGQTWKAINGALSQGHRGLSGGTTLARVLEQHRGAPRRASLTRLTIQQVLDWVDAHHAATGHWPSKSTGAVTAAPGEIWSKIDSALEKGDRGLPGRSSLVRLLNQHRGRPSKAALPRFSVDQVLAWADAHFTARGQWPIATSGPVAGAPDVTWGAIHMALTKGARGLPGRTTLPRFLEQHRGRPNKAALPSITVDQILAWADAYFAAHGRWPAVSPEPVTGVPHLTWRAIDDALVKGHRGLSGGTSLPRLLNQHRGRPNTAALPRLSVDQVLAWADAHFAAHGRWPSCRSGPVAAAPGVTWSALNAALGKGQRGLPGGTTLARLLAPHKRSLESQGSQSASLESK